MEVGKGFLQLQEDSSRRSSLHPPLSIGEGDPTSAYTTRLGCCGCCTVKVERDDGSVRIGRLSLAPYCHLALLVFGFCFLLAGVVLSGLAYSSNQDLKQSPLMSAKIKKKIEDRNEERVAGPLFVVVGLCLIVFGVGLAVLGCKLERAAARTRSALSRFSFESSVGNQNRSGGGDIFANLDDIRFHDQTRRNSFFGSSFNFNPSSSSTTRRSTLSTIAQAVPLGFFMTESPRTPKTFNNSHLHPNANPNYTDNFSLSPISTNAGNVATTKLSNEFQEVELGSPVREDGDDEFKLPALSLRPSIIPIPMFISPNHLNHGQQDMLPIIPSRSDEPYGSIVGLGGAGRDIASFPEPRARPIPTPTPNINSNIQISDGLPPIHVMETGNALTSLKQSANVNGAIRPPLRATRSSEDHTIEQNESDNALNVSVEGIIRRPHSGS